LWRLLLEDCHPGVVEKLVQDEWTSLCPVLQGTQPSSPGRLPSQAYEVPAVSRGPCSLQLGNLEQVT
jgi:hypothetical protein